MTERGPRQKLGRLEVQALALTQSRGQDVVRTGDLQEGLGLRPLQERELLSRMATSGLVVRLSRGVYLFPRRMPPGGIFAPGTFLVLARLMAALGARYQVGGPNAFHVYGFEEQVPNLTYVFNDTLSGERRVGRYEFVFIKLKPSRLGGARPVEVPDGPHYQLATRERTLLDAVQYWSRFGSLPGAYGWIRRTLAACPDSAPSLVACTVEFGTPMAGRRVGACLEQAGVAAAVLEPLLARHGRPGTRIPYVPGAPVRGRTLASWGVVLND